MHYKTIESVTTCPKITEDSNVEVTKGNYSEEISTEDDSSSGHDGKESTKITDSSTVEVTDGKDAGNNTELIATKDVSSLDYNSTEDAAGNFIELCEIQ